MTILELKAHSNDENMKSNNELNKLLSMKSIKQKRTQEKQLVKNINWFNSQIKSYKTKIPTGVNYKIDLIWQKPANDQHGTEVSTDSKSVCFHSNCMSCFETTAIRADKPLKRNTFTYWETTLMNDHVTGTSLMIGIGTSSAKTHSSGYVNLLGINEKSWGLTHTGQTWHSNKSKNFCTQFEPIGPITIGCLFDGFTGTLSYFKNGTYLGVAFSNLLSTKENLYPMCSSTSNQSVFKLDVAYQSMPSLQDICKQVVIQNGLDYSQLPKLLINELKKN